LLFNTSARFGSDAPEQAFRTNEKPMADQNEKRPSQLMPDGSGVNRFQGRINELQGAKSNTNLKLFPIVGQKLRGHPTLEMAPAIYFVKEIDA
jgi:hypothetical protein